jgi:large subunit ribosomal protein L25
LIEIDHNALWHALKKEAFHASVLQMEFAGKTTEVLLRDVQYHPFKQLVLHIDFQRIDGNTKMKKKVPVHYSGEENSPAVKVDQCLINHIATELEVSCMPKDLPEFISVDLSNLTKGHSLHVNDITLPAGVTAVTRGKSNPVLVAVVATKAEAPTPQETAAAAGTDKKKK